MNITTSQLMDSLSVLDTLCPGFSDALYAKVNEISTAKKNAIEAEKANLLQEEKNLTEEIDKLNAQMSRLDNEIDTIRTNIDSLTAKREQIHKMWISKYSQNNVAKPTPDYSEYSLAGVFNDFIGGEVNEFKRFDNLIHKRCRFSKLFNVEDNLYSYDDIIEVLENNAPADVVEYVKYVHDHS